MPNPLSTLQEPRTSRAVEGDPSLIVEADTDYSDHLTKLVAYFEEAENNGREARERSERCRDYYNNVQLTADELATLKKRGQPPIYVNYIQRKVDTLCGLERRSRTDPKAFPRNPQDEQASEAATDSLRYVADQNKFNGLRSEVYNDILVEGCGGADITIERMPDGDLMVTATRIAWDRLVYDVHSRQLDFSDAKYKGIVLWMDAADARAKWPDFLDSINYTLSTSASETYDDRPRYGMWCDSKRKRVRVVQMHYEEEGEWFICTFTKGGFLEEPVISPYKDRYGRSCSSLHLRAAYIDRENNKFGHVEGLIPLQDEINKRRSKSLHLLSQRQTFGRKSALLDTAKAKIELAKADGHVELNDGAEFGRDFGVIPTGDMASGQIQLMQQALAEMNASGANAAMQGKDERAQSGVALQTRIQAGAVEMEPLADGLRMWTKEVFESMWMLIRQFWTEEKWIRVTDDDRNIRFVGLNKKVTVADKLASMPEQNRAMMMQQMGIGPGDPRLLEVVGVENDVTGLDVDIVIEEGPDMASLQSEQFEILAKLAQSGMPIPPKALIQASAIRADKKTQILDEMEKGSGQVPPEVQQQMQTMQADIMEKTKQLAQMEMKLNDKSAEYRLKDRELTIKEQEVAMRGRTAQDGPSALPEAQFADVELTGAKVRKTNAETNQINLENAHAYATAMTQPQPQGVDQIRAPVRRTASSGGPSAGPVAGDSGVVLPPGNQSGE